MQALSSSGVEANLSLSQRASSWRRVVAGPARFAANTALCATALGMALVARNGTLLSRSLAFAGCALAVAVVVGIWLLRGRRTSDARQLVRRVIVPTDPKLGARALRAAGLVEREDAGDAPLSRALARVHLERVIEGATLQRVERAAARRALRYRALGLALAAIVTAIVAFALRELLEGFDVLVARGPRAPVPMTWTERLRITAQPPAYLRAPPRRLSSGGSALLPKGTNLTLRARPRFEGRSLVVSDGESEFPFVSDGEGGIVAHYTVDRDASLVVAARFGDVLIPEPEVTLLTALGDEAPVVDLEGAPASLSLSDLRRLELRWTALDDHGLRQVDLVLRSGTREERRVLATFDGESAEQRGAHVLLASDPFLRSLYLPAQISIEAKDNDPVQGAKWGVSAAFEIVPTAVGEADAQRYLALARSRDRFVDALAAADAAAALPDAAGEAVFHARLADAVRDFDHATTTTYGGLRVPPGFRNLALGRLRVLAEQAGAAPRRAQALGEMILAVDSVLASLSTRDAQRVAKVLAEVAEEAMVGAGQARSLEGDREVGIERLERATAALTRGAEQLLLLGNLGNDIGSVALADLGRVQRARQHSDFFHAELAARHLADRLRRPTPSFGAQGSGGVEAGQSGSSEPSGQASGAEQEFDQLVWEIAQLVRDHASAVERVDEALSDAQSAIDHEAVRAEAERRAAELRQSVIGFPLPGHTPESAEADAALAAEHARAMAHNLESLRLDAAAENGKRAQGALRDALGKAGAESALGAEASAADAVVSEQLAWLSSQLEAAKKEAKERARSLLEEPAAREQQLAEAAGRLADRGERDATPLPSEVTSMLRQADQLMRQASRSLGEGEGEQGLKLQREAQRLLETADQGSPRDSDEGPDRDASGHEDGDARPPGFGGDVPDAEEQNKTEEFRRRVLRNLGESGSGRLGPAIRRYAEGLLR